MVTKQSKEQKETKELKEKTLQYYEAVGRRKSSVARVRISQANPSLTINNKTLEEYFADPVLKEKVLKPLKETNLEKKLSVSVQVKGGGTTGQAEAISLGLSRSLVLLDEKLRTSLRQKGLLTRDSRVVERKKYGLKKARRAPQWQKR
ncbi:MAG: small subunit ribosomal protein [Patescibacteria group bacterium]|nr:small subunit ribosomal protein [Patescibacteria group bacterium]